MIQPSSQRRVKGRDRGATLITFAISLVAICAVIALVIGASIGYSTERNSQTASDAAALAGASKLRAYQLGDATFASIDQSVSDVAEANDADADDVVCEVVRPGYASSPTSANVLGACTDPAAVDHAEAAGVRVLTGETRDVPFGEVSRMEDVRGATLAAATVQPLMTGASPFMLCSSQSPVGHPLKVLEDTPGSDGVYDIRDEALYKEATDAPYFVLWGNDMKAGNRQCNDDGADEDIDPGDDEAWRGLVQSGNRYETPGYWDTKSGNTTGALGRMLQSSDSCDLADNPQIADLDEWCEIIVPLCITDNGESGTNKELYCVAFGRFEIGYFGPTSALGDARGDAPCQNETDDGNAVICGRLLGAGTATTGTGREDVASVNDVVVIKLVE